jgi:hypothetical protein
MLLEIALAVASIIFLLAAARAAKIPMSRIIVAVPLALACGLFMDSLLVSLYRGGFESLANAPSRAEAVSMGILVLLVSLSVSSYLVWRMLRLDTGLEMILPIMLLLMLIVMTVVVSMIP